MVCEDDAEHHVLDRDLVHLANAFADDGERATADLAVRAQVVGTDQNAGRSRCGPRIRRSRWSGSLQFDVLELILGHLDEGVVSTL